MHAKPSPAPSATPLASPLASPSASSTPWPTFWIACIAVFLVSLDSTMLFAAFGAIKKSFPDSSAADISWVINAYTVVYAAFLIPAGGLADTHGRKKIFLIGVALFLAASVACGLSGSVPWLVAARVAQALGAAMLTPASLSIVLSAFPQSKRAIAVSLWGAVGGFAAAVGPSLGSFVIDTVGWPWAFFLNLPLGALSLWYGAKVLKEAPRSETPRKLDGVGVVLLIVAVGSLALTIVQSESPLWSRTELAFAGALGFVALGSFVAWAKVAPAPLVDLRLFSNRTYSMVNIATLAFGTAFSMMFFSWFFYLTQLWHYSLPQAGLAVTPGPLLVVPVAIVTGRLAARLGHRRFLVGGGIVMTLAALWFMFVPGVQPNYLAHWLPGLLLSGLCVGMVMPSLAASAVNRLPITQYAVGSAVNQAIRQIGSVLGVAITVLLLGHAELQRGDFTMLYTCMAVLASLVAILCVGVDTRPVHTTLPVAQSGAAA